MIVRRLNVQAALELFVVEEKAWTMLWSIQSHQKLYDIVLIILWNKINNDELVLVC